MSDQELRSLAQAAAGGDLDAAEALFVAIHPHLRTFLAICGAAELADDVAQDAALRIHAGLASYDPTQAFLPWMRTVARNTLANQRRSQTREFRRREGLKTEPAIPSAEITEAVAEEAAQMLLRDRLGSCMQGLADRSRHMLELCYREGMASDAIANALGMTGQAVRKALSRTRQALRRCLEQAT